jgi:hypothetical protein
MDSGKKKSQADLGGSSEEAVSGRVGCKRSTFGSANVDCYTRPLSSPVRTRCTEKDQAGEYADTTPNKAIVIL